MNEKQTPMMRTNEAVAGLNKVAGFDPVKLLQKTLSRKPTDKAEAARLELRYKKLWFRLAYPQGRIRVSAVRITEQLAIIEAKVFLHKDDAEPVANFMAERAVQDTPLYIQAAQYEAQDNALTDAGFGIQLCDVCQTVGEEAYTPRQAVTVQTPPQPAVEEAPAPAAQAETPLPAEKVEEPAPDADTASPAVEEVEPAEEPPTPDTPVEESPADDLPTSSAPIEATPPDEAVPVQEAEEPAVDENAGAEPVAEVREEPLVQVAEGEYSPSMTVDEIAARMTLEEALSTVADVGMCRGQTLAQIADRRPASLRWYMLGCKEASNALKAGAKLVLDSLAMPKSA